LPTESDGFDEEERSWNRIFEHTQAYDSANIWRRNVGWGGAEPPNAPSGYASD